MRAVRAQSEVARQHSRRLQGIVIRHVLHDELAFSLLDQSPQEFISCSDWLSDRRHDWLLVD